MSAHDLALSHFTSAEAVVPRTIDDQQSHGRFGKPTGLWVSVDGDDDWPSWCKSEEFRDVDSQNRFRVTLVAEANILHLTTFDDVVAFSEKYGEASQFGVGYDDIRWAEVAANYQGIVIAPYSWQARNDRQTFWYYGWDCASGCIWDAAAIAEVTR
jgi:hypothetical protein